ncbi:hypothetical protein [Kitasatospora sp. NPDC018619]|uniref:hypothetical protein n=1 Tax=unclassified Kitasatospora TaxID=2633591 RepID=UPI003789B099
MGEATGLSVRSIRGLERGVSCPRVSTLRLLTRTWDLPDAQAAELHRQAPVRLAAERRRRAAPAAGAEGTARAPGAGGATSPAAPGRGR